MNNSAYRQEWQHLHSSTSYYKGLLNLPEAALRQKPPGNAWSLLQILEHMVGIEKAVLSYLKKKEYTAIPDKGTLPNRLRALLLSLALKSPLRFKVPRVEGLSPANTTPPAALAREWQAVRDELADYVEKFPEKLEGKAVFRHPRAGGLSLRQTLQFITDHMNHHRRQTAEQLRRLKEVTPNK